MNLGPNFFVVRIPNGLAVVSKTYFQSQKVLSQLNPQFKGGNLNVTSEKIQKLFDSKTYTLNLEKNYKEIVK